MSTRPVGRRQLRQIDSVRDIYDANAGGGVNRKPYNTDEFDLFKADLDADEKLNEEIKKKLPQT